MEPDAVRGGECSSGYRSAHFLRAKRAKLPLLRRLREPVTNRVELSSASPLADGGELLG